MADAYNLIPEVSDADVEWISSVMNLREFDEPRQSFIRARTGLDISACPGSGKTTLVVAKLAIMARKWPHRARGICVLSHTNAAREEIQRRLGAVVGQQLLSYPHFIDTIHGFVNRFLALPWLNSNGFPSVTVDDDVTSAFRRGAVSNAEYRKVESFLRRKYSGFDRIRIEDRDLHFGLGNRRFPACPTAASHQIAKRSVEVSSAAGYFCYDEMFIWANALLSDYPEVSTALCHRFPLVIIDEMQDTSELQVGILDSVFPRSEVVLQRVGDPNQAIYDGAFTSSTSPGAYPDSSMCQTIPNSFRFGSQIAALASPFAVDAVGLNGLKGVGPRVVEGAPQYCQNAVFIFPDDSTEGVLEAYGRHVLAYFRDDALQKGAVAAVGAVHQDASEVTAGHAHFPKTVPHYWSGYTAEVARREPHPRTFVQYVRVAQAIVRDGRNLSPGVEKIAYALVRLARRAGGAERMGRRAPTHRALVDALATNVQAVAAYRRLLSTFLIDLEAQTSASWCKRRADILEVAASLNDMGTAPDATDSFLQWDEHATSPAVTSTTSPRDASPNVYRVDDGTGRKVDIHLGSVHSKKGQTHLATLLLNTYWHDHSSKRMLPWLLGEKVNLAGAGTRDCARLRQIYVAMTRPSHMVCLAVPRSALGDEAAAVAGHVSALRGRGWSVADVVEGGAQWYS